LIRRVWIGSPPTSQIQAQMEHYHSYASDRAKANWIQGDSTVFGQNGAEAAERLSGIVHDSGCDTVNIRVHVAGLKADQVIEQLGRHKDDLVPVLKSDLKRG
ncbi:MAG: hypothetical protein ACPGO0_06085, partial [Acidimicrobiales bacterium]